MALQLNGIVFLIHSRW